MTCAPRQFRVFGMRRSGNHAVIGWLRRNIPGEVVFLNDCDAGDPFRTYAMLETPRRDRHGPAFRDSRWFAQFDAGRAERSHIVSYEDMTPDDAGTPEGWTVPFETVVVRRSFLNWLASFYALVTGRTAGTVWGVDHPREIGAYRRVYAALLRAPAAAVICFDRWLEEAAYRRERLAALGLPARDNALGAVSAYGGGSSFAGGHPSCRWRPLAGDPAFAGLARAAGRDDAFLGTLEPLYPDDAARLRRLAAGGVLHDER